MSNSNQVSEGTLSSNKTDQSACSSERTSLENPEKSSPSLRSAFCFLLHSRRAVAQAIPSGVPIDAEVSKIMSHTNAKGMAVAVVDHGKVGYVHAYGIRNAKGDPRTTDTVMYGASLTKTVFAYTVMQLIDQGKLKLDTPIKDDLDNPLPSYGPDPVSRQARPVPGSSRPFALGKAHAAYVPHPFDWLQQLLVHRTRPKTAHPFRTRHAL
jgi:CubicO group peptidase (beta-lactamase class C family)